MSGVGGLLAALTGFAGGVGAAMEKDIQRKHEEKLRELEHKYRLEEQDHLGEINLKQSEINHQHKLDEQNQLGEINLKQSEINHRYKTEEQKFGERIQLRLLQEQYMHSLALEDRKNAHALNREALRYAHSLDVAKAQYDYGVDLRNIELQNKLREQDHAATTAQQNAMFLLGLGVSPDRLTASSNSISSKPESTGKTSATNSVSKERLEFLKAMVNCAKTYSNDAQGYHGCVAKVKDLYNSWDSPGDTNGGPAAGWGVDLTGDPKAVKTFLDRLAAAVPKQNN